MGSNFRSLLIILFLTTSCRGVVDISLKQKPLPTEEDTSLASSLFTVVDVPSTNELGGFSKSVTLAYTERDSLLATKCEVGNANKITGNSCTCDVAGVCSVLLSGDSGKLGAGSLDYRVGDDSGFSNWGKIEFELICPSGFLKVSSLNTVNSNNDFCVMRTEAKDVFGYPSSTNLGQPITGLNLVQAKSSCNSLNTLNSLTLKYDLIANEEWMNIARRIESNSVNWSNGVIDHSNELNRGHSDLDPYNVLEISDDSNPYDGTNNSSLDLPSIGWEQKRTHILEDNQEIWDFSGNVWEWVDASLDAALITINPSYKPYYSVNGVPTFAYLELTQIDRLIGETTNDYFLPERWQPSDSSLSHDQGVGQYYAGDNSTGGAMIRGGAYFEGNRAGIYSLGLDQEQTANGNWLGFRCVFRP